MQGQTLRKDDRGCSPLHVACELGELPIVKMLVDAGADVRVADDKSNTGLLFAAHYGHTETVRHLLCDNEYDKVTKHERLRVIL